MLAPVDIDVCLQVILPEGAHNIVALPPFEGVSEARTERFTFLDTTGSGRPVVVLKMKNVVKEHNEMLKVGLQATPRGPRT